MIATILVLFSIVTAQLLATNCAFGRCSRTQFVGVWKVQPLNPTAKLFCPDLKYVINYMGIFKDGWTLAQIEKARLTADAFELARVTEVCNGLQRPTVGIPFTDKSKDQTVTYTLSPIGVNNPTSFQLKIEKIWTKGGKVVAATVTQQLIGEYLNSKSTGRPAVVPASQKTLWIYNDVSREAVSLTDQEIIQIRAAQ